MLRFPLDIPSEARKNTNAPQLETANKNCITSYTKRLAKRGGGTEGSREIETRVDLVQMTQLIIGLEVGNNSFGSGKVAQGNKEKSLLIPWQLRIKAPIAKRFILDLEAVDVLREVVVAQMSASFFDAFEQHAF